MLSYFHNPIDPNHREHYEVCALGGLGRADEHGVCELKSLHLQHNRNQSLRLAPVFPASASLRDCCAAVSEPRDPEEGTTPMHPDHPGRDAGPNATRWPAQPVSLLRLPAHTLPEHRCAEGIETVNAGQDFMSRDPTVSGGACAVPIRPQAYVHMGA
ncbi:hypothetical protein NDU88_009342 [Pleurodeles waltl]|uniref:Uncharacterized protein n=1 Tax=Pleurodeles waltl TaxID=8319 RepID=A0AAV7RWB3_PLEWA|nr:hypothetical protein NDU88_009342 [Pleurodeles waltl]